jgi:uncharacterized phage protein (TIGR02218 family)
MTLFEELVASEVTRLVLCWRLIRRDGVVLGFTAHDRDIVLAGQRYASTPSFTPSALVRSAGTDVDSIDVRGALSHAAIREADLLAGRYDAAHLRFFMLDWQQPEAGAIDLGSGRLGSVSCDGSGFSVEVRGLTEALDRSIVELTSPECRADLGDKRCRVNVRSVSRGSSVVARTDNQIFEAEGLSSYTDAYAYGRLRWRTGANSGSDAEVVSQVLISEASFDNTRLRLTLREPPLHAVAVGDRFEISYGCDKRYATCVGRFGNQLNFRGEPFVPGVDALLRYPDA